MYIDGGETVYINNTSPTPTAAWELRRCAKYGRAPYPLTIESVNLTLSLDMRSAWTNASVEFTTIARGQAPLLEQVLIWGDANLSSFYIYGGGTSWTVIYNHVATANPGTPWKFTPDGNGSGSWSEVTDSVTQFDELLQPMNEMFTAGQGKGYYFGGCLTDQTKPAVGVGDCVPVPGLSILQLDGATIQSENLTTTNFEGGTGAYGKAHFVPAWGSEGLILMLGVAPPIANQSVAPPSWLSMETVNIFDISSQQWYNQTTRSSTVLPSWRTGFCATGVSETMGLMRCECSGYLKNILC